MARTVTVSELKTRIRQRADVENDTNIGEAELMSLLNSNYPWYWDLLEESALPDYHVNTYLMTTVADQESYSLDSLMPQFYRLRSIQVEEGNGRWRPLYVVPDMQLEFYRPVSVTGLNVRVRYVPCCPVLSDDDDTIDGVNGYDEALVLRCAADIKRKRNEDPSHLLRAIGEIEARIRRHAKRDIFEPNRIVRRNGRKLPYYWDYQKVHGYVMRASTIELFEYVGRLW